MSEKLSNSGVGFLGLLTIAFIVLKLVGVINWSWVWVVSPLWIGIVFVLGFCLILLVLFIFSRVLKNLFTNNKRSNKNKKRRR